jgi:hypothetical protein
MVSILNKPSSLVHEICLEQVESWKLFKFSESLQQRMEILLEKKKADQLVADEIAELDSIGELDHLWCKRSYRILTHINAMTAAQDPQWLAEIGGKIDAAKASLARGEGVDFNSAMEQILDRFQQAKRKFQSKNVIGSAES